MNLHDNIISLPYELQEEIYRFVYPTPIDFQKFKKMIEYTNKNKDYIPYYANKFINVSIETHWNNYKKNPVHYPEIQIQNFYANHNLWNIIDYCIDTRFPICIVDLLEQYVKFDKTFIERISKLYEKHFYRDWDKIPSLGKIYFWNDESVNEEEFYNDIIELLNDMEGCKTNESVMALYKIYRSFMYIYYHYHNELI